MAHLRMDLWALPLAGEPAPLPDLRQWTVSPTDGDDGSIEFAYPAAGRNSGLLLDLAEDDVDLEVEVRIRDGAGRTWTDHAILDEVDLDDVAETDLVTVRGRLLSVIFREVRVPYFPAGENGETPVAGTGGRIARELLEAAQARGCLAGVTWSFTDTEDSAGQPWARSGNFRLSPGQDYGAFLGVLRGYQLAEYRLTADRELLLYNPDGNGTDRTVGPNPLTLEHGRDLGDAPRKFRLRDTVTDLLTSGKDGIYSAFGDASARARRGRRIEGYYSFGNAADQGTLDALTQARLGTVTNGRTEVSHRLALGPGHPTPLLDFDTADYVYSATRRGVARRRVRQITITGDEHEATSAAVTLGVLIDERAVAQQRLIDDLASGAAVTGTSSPPPDVDDGSTPEAPDGASVVVNGRWYSTGEGVGAVSLTAAWTAIPDSRVVGYVVEWRYTEAAYGTAWQARPQVDGTSVSWSGVAPGAPVEVRVRAANRWGRVGPPSSPVYTLTTPVKTTPPPVASTPAPYSHLGLYVVPWDGKGSAGEAMPGDLDVAEVHISTTSGFAEDRPVDGAGKLNLAASTTYAGEMRAAGELPIDIGAAGYGTTFYVRLVTRNRSGVAAAGSAQGSAVLAQVADGDVAELNVGKLRTGILTALMTVAGMIRTSLTGARVELDTAGLRCIAADGRILLEFSIPTSLLTIIGKLISGQGVGTGSTIVIDPGPPPSISLYPTATTQRTRMQARSTLRPDGSTAAGLEIDTINTSGQTDGFSVSAWSTNVWIGHRLTSGLFSGGKLILQRVGGGAYLKSETGEVSVDDANGAALGTNAGSAVVASTSGAIRAYNNSGAQVLIESDGDIRIDPAAGKEFTSSQPVGTSGAGFSFKIQGLSGSYRTYFDSAANCIRFVDNASNTYVSDGAGGLKSFVIPHPTDSARWLVHGCTESPYAGVEYWGEAVITDHAAVVQLPSYFEALTRPEGRQVQLTVALPDTAVDTPAVAGTPGAVGPAMPGEPWPLVGIPGRPRMPEHVRLPRAAASVPRNGKFRISCDGPDGTKVVWLVKAIRKDVPPLDPEPLRSAVKVSGTGPYRYIDGSGGGLLGGLLP